MQRHTGSSSGSSSALCLALEKGGPPQNWAPLVLAPCTSSDRKQQWRYTAGARPVLQYAGYKNANGNAMCIQIDGENPWLGSPAGLWPCSAAGEWCVASMCASCNRIQSIFFGGGIKKRRSTPWWFDSTFLLSPTNGYANRVRVRALVCTCSFPMIDAVPPHPLLILLQKARDSQACTFYTCYTYERLV